MQKYFSIIFLISSLIIAQNIQINEILSSNTSGIVDEDGDTPDWIELFNESNTSINLSDFYLSDDLDSLSKWKFSSIDLNPESFLIVFASGKNRASDIAEWETIINWGDEWKYLLPDNQTSGNWRELDFDDSGWATGHSGFGYGDDDDSTVIPKTMSIFLRKKFVIDDMNDISGLFFHIDFDDGFAVFLNGNEIGRDNLGTPNTNILYNQSANNYVEPLIAYGRDPFGIDLNSKLDLLRQGENIIAVEVHNHSINSSDLTAIPFLTIGYKSAKGDRQVNPLLPLQYANFHTNFSLKTGESLYLSKAGVVIDSVSIPDLPSNFSFGRIENGNWMIFTNPTPGSLNNSEGFTGISGEIQPNYEPDIYSSQINLVLSTTDNSTIHFTTDGSDVNENCPVFSGTLKIDKTTTIKARSYTTGYLPGKLFYGTYIIGEPNLPVVSITTDPVNLWDSDSGIYVKGNNADSNYPYFGANFWEDWEKKAHFELYEPGEGLVASENCGIKIFGAYSRAWDQKSLAVFFRGKYGNKELNYKIFPDLSIAKFKSIVLRNSGNDWQSTMLRDGFLQTLIKDLDIEHQAYRPSIVYLNGEYWGIHNIREKINEDFIASHFSLNPKNIDLLQNNSEILEGSNETYNIMLDFINTHNLANDENFEIVSSMMDVDNFIDYLLCELFFNNLDWPGNNIKYWRESNSFPRWRWILYDVDFGFGLFDEKDYRFNTLEFALEENGPFWPNPPWSTFLFRNLIKNDSFKQKFINRFCDLSNSVFRPERVKGILDSLVESIKPEIGNHISRWNQFDIPTWERNIANLKNFADFRLPFMRIHFINKFDLGATSLLKLNLNDVKMGNIIINSLKPDNYPFSGIYFTGMTTRLEAIPNDGYRFVGWEGDINSTNRILEINLDDVTDLTAVFEYSGEEGTIVINEINYNSAPDFDTKDWLELYNKMDFEVSISGWKLSDANLSNAFEFPQGLLIPAQGYFVVCRDTASFDSLFPGIKNRIGNLSFNLSNGGEYIQLVDPSGNIVDSLTYDDKAPWPTEPDGNGPTLELVDPFADNSIPANWDASTGHGSPGTENTTTTLKEEYTKLSFDLRQNYPNPFNPATNIEYTIPLSENGKYTESNVKLVIYDILGKEVKTLVNEKQSPGIYLVRFDGGNLSSGIYFYRLTFDKFAETKKMILLK